MYTCPNCKATSENPSNFCLVCGSAMTPPTQEPAADAPAYQQPPVYTQQPPMYTQPPYVQATYVQPAYRQPAPAGPSKAKGIVGMALGIAGFVFAIIGFLYTLIFSALEGSVAFGMSIGFGFFSLPLSIIGMVLSISARNAGDQRAFAKVGKILGMIGLILSCVSILFGIIFMAADSGNGYGSYRYDYYW